MFEYGSQTPIKFKGEYDQRIYAFDFDNTLMYGNAIPEWVLIKINQIKHLPIVIFTNQLGISQGKTTADSVRERLDKFKTTCGFQPIATTARADECSLEPADGGVEATACANVCSEQLYIFVATANDNYRKPHVEMFQTFMRKYVTGNPRIIFCGDAAGRPGDHNDTDRKFAMNCRMEFVTPEVFFGLRQRDDPGERYVWRGVDPVDAYDRLMKSVPKLTQRVRELVIMVGPPSSGKSTFAKNIFHGYVYINQDELKTRQKCVKETIRAARFGTSIVVDNTNPSADVRKLYVDIAREHNYYVRCVYVSVDMELAKHLNGYRVAQGGRAIPNVAYGAYQRRFEFPAPVEGFDEILTVLPGPWNLTEKLTELFMHRYSN